MITITLRAAVITRTANTSLKSRTEALRLKSRFDKTCADRFSSTAVPNKMTLRRCPQTTTVTTTATNTIIKHNTIPDSQKVVKRWRPSLVVLMGWTLAKDKHLESYRQMWFTRGFDVLTVRTSPIDYLVPSIGGKVVAYNLANYLLEINEHYNRIVIHTFSAGCYQFALLLSKLRSTDQYNPIGESIGGVICDSIVHTDGFGPGLPQAITTNPILQSMLERSIRLLLKLIPAAKYECAKQEFYEMYVRCPALVLYSEDDVVSNAKKIRELISAWSELGMCVHSKCWNASEHVRHYREHTQEYEQQIDAFLQSIDLCNSADDVS